METKNFLILMLKLSQAVNGCSENSDESKKNLKEVINKFNEITPTIEQYYIIKDYIRNLRVDLEIITEIIKGITFLKNKEFLLILKEIQNFNSVTAERLKEIINSDKLVFEDDNEKNDFYTALTTITIYKTDKELVDLCIKKIESEDNI